MRTLRMLSLAEVCIFVIASTLPATDVSGPVSGT
jgi:hypothetical protein